MKPVQPKTIDKEKLMRTAVLAELVKGNFVVMISNVNRLYVVKKHKNRDDMYFRHAVSGENYEEDSAYFNGQFYSFSNEDAYVRAIKNDKFSLSKVI